MPRELVPGVPNAFAIYRMGHTNAKSGWFGPPVYGDLLGTQQVSITQLYFTMGIFAKDSDLVQRFCTCSTPESR